MWQETVAFYEHGGYAANPFLPCSRKDVCLTVHDSGEYTVVWSVASLEDYTFVPQACKVAQLS